MFSCILKFATTHACIIGVYVCLQYKQCRISTSNYIDTDPNYSDKKSQTVDTLKNISSLDDYKGGQPVREGLENPDRDSSINSEEYEMELRNRDTTSDRANTESSAV